LGVNNVDDTGQHASLAIAGQFLGTYRDLSIYSVIAADRDKPLCPVNYRLAKHVYVCHIADQHDCAPLSTGLKPIVALVLLDNDYSFPPLTKVICQQEALSA